MIRCPSPPPPTFLASSNFPPPTISLAFTMWYSGVSRTVKLALTACSSALAACCGLSSCWKMLHSSKCACSGRGQAAFTHPSCDTSLEGSQDPYVKRAACLYNSWGKFLSTRLGLSFNYTLSTGNPYLVVKERKTTEWLLCQNSFFPSLQQSIEFKLSGACLLTLQPAHLIVFRVGAQDV